MVMHIFKGKRVHEVKRVNLMNFRGQQRGASQEPWDRTLMWRGDTDPAASDLQFGAEIQGLPVWLNISWPAISCPLISAQNCMPLSAESVSPRHIKVRFHGS